MLLATTTAAAIVFMATVSLALVAIVYMIVCMNQVIMSCIHIPLPPNPGCTSYKFTWTILFVISLLYLPSAEAPNVPTQNSINNDSIVSATTATAVATAAAAVAGIAVAGVRRSGRKRKVSKKTADDNEAEAKKMKAAERRREQYAAKVQNTQSREERNKRDRKRYANMDDDKKEEKQSQARENKQKNTNRIKKQKVGSALTEDINDVERYTLGNMDCKCHYCGALGFWCENKGTKTEPHFGNLCCQKGKVSVPLAQDFQLHPYIANLLTSTTDRDAIYFRSHARMFNAGMAMASTVSGKVPNEYSKGNSAYSIAGQLRRILGPMMPRKGNVPRYIQIYFFEPDDATAYRIRNFADLKPDEKAMAERIFTQLHKALIESKHAYVQSCLGVKKWVEENFPDGVNDLRIAINAEQSPDPTIHNGRLNAPAAVNEVSILVPEHVGKDDVRQVVFNLKEPEDSMGTKTIADYHRSYDPLQYPIFNNL